MLPSLQLDEGLMILEEAIQKAKKIMEGYPETKFTSEEYMKFHLCVYVLCTNPGRDGGNEMLLYDRFKKSLEESIISTDYKNDFVESLETSMEAFGFMFLGNFSFTLVFQDVNISPCTLRFFEYLDRDGVVSLKEISVSCFSNLVFTVLDCRIQAAVISLINRERLGNQIDSKLLQDVLSIFLELDTSYYKKFERAVLEETANFYSQLASQWILYDSMSTYVQKVKWCVMQEKERASCYLHPISREKLMQVVRRQLLGTYANKLIEKQQSQKRNQLEYEEILSKCASLSLEDETSTSTLEEMLSSLMANSARIG